MISDHGGNHNLTYWGVFFLVILLTLNTSLSLREEHHGRGDRKTVRARGQGGVLPNDVFWHYMALHPWTQDIYVCLRERGCWHFLMKRGEINKRIIWSFVWSRQVDLLYCLFNSRSTSNNLVPFCSFQSSHTHINFPFVYLGCPFCQASHVKVNEEETGRNPERLTSAGINALGNYDQFSTLHFHLCLS